MHIPAPKSTKPLLRRLRHQSVRWWRSIMVVQDTPHRVGWGFAIGIFIGWLPIMGVQIPTAGLLTWIFRGNIVASMAAVWISNPLTVVPMYYFINRVGAPIAGDAIRFSEIKDHMDTMMSMGMWESMAYAADTLLGAFIAMTVGGTIVGILSALPAYFLIKAVATTYHNRRMERRLRWLGIVEPPQALHVDTSASNHGATATQPEATKDKP